MMNLLVLSVLYTIILANVNCLEDPHVIIIGAGASGISAATRLYQNGIKNIRILEAENRIGGRVYSVKVGDRYIDLGAQWCHGEKNNVVYSLVKDLNILKSDEFIPNLYHSELGLIDKSFSDEIIKIFETFNVQNYEKEGSLGEAFITKYNETIRETWKGEEGKIALAEDCLGLLEKWTLAYESALSWFDVAAASNYEVCEGNQLLGWNGLGYKTILEVLMHRFPDAKNPIPLEDRIILNKEVTQINWEDSSTSKKVVVKCSDGTSYLGDHVISTVSLGVFKDRYKTLFQPQLPREKITAIQAIGFGAVSKIFLHFADKWWGDSFSIGFIWNQTDLENTAILFTEGPKHGGRSWITSVVDITSVSNTSNILAVWVSGEFVTELEQTSDEIIVNGILYLLNRFLRLDHHNITRPEKLIRNNWYSNRHFCGTYSFETVETQRFGKPQEVLAEPLLLDGKPVILFAGEATSVNHHSTVHGAIETGYREADRLVDLYK